MKRATCALRHFFAGLSIFVLLFCSVAIGEKAESDSPALQEDPFVGEWVEPTAGRAQLTIEQSEDGYNIFIFWSNSAFEHFEWHMTGVYNAAVDAIVCEDCRCIDVIYEEDGNDDPQEEVLYTDGDAAFSIQNGSIKWQDAQEDAGADIVFIKNEF